jgi:hypothetical protein
MDGPRVELDKAPKPAKAARFPGVEQHILSAGLERRSTFYSGADEPEGSKPCFYYADNLAYIDQPDD